MVTRRNYIALSYQPGQKAPETGVYAVTHSTHRRDHEVIVVRGEDFPECRTCGNDVSFRLVKIVRHVTHDFDLSGPGLRLVKRAQTADFDSR